MTDELASILVIVNCSSRIKQAFVDNVHISSWRNKENPKKQKF